MTTAIGRAALRSTRRLRAAHIMADDAPMYQKFTHADNSAGQRALREGAKRDWELVPLYIITAATVSFGFGYFFSHPTGKVGAPALVPKVANSEPWKDSSTKGAYKYVPHSDLRNPPKNAPSAMHSVIVPNVTLPRSLHQEFNKYGKPEWEV
ncbi:hypothetical protein EJ06DRAFT_20221 [Trichodelitschia bisporula]|uniref:Uncharacterized protein n=1 Tax=Trichodelitschia bisporula TaxID=703511 RepID=A0A6G1IAU0_9PEZI|nr:hypothetical protein EJ06DRAFT_20221 [Trichodelitschia bisporula]